MLYRTCTIFVLILIFTLCPATAQDPEFFLPMVASCAEVPLYPSLARAANVEGVVRLKVKTDGEHILSVDIETKESNRLLVEAAEANVRTWQFAKHTPTAFVVSYQYRLEDSSSNANNPTVLLKLPTDVVITRSRMRLTTELSNLNR